MNQESKTTGQAPVAVGVSAGQEPIKYETGKGCLLFVVIGLVLLGVMVGMIVVLGDPTPIAG
jgi:hypothetical protein